MIELVRGERIDLKAVVIKPKTVKPLGMYV